METNKENLNALTHTIIGAAIEVHRALGPGLLESTYETRLVWELAQRGLKVERRKPLPITYKDVQLDAGYRIDLLVNGLVIVELKAVETVLPIHEQQVLSYLKLSALKIGLLINFNVEIPRDGVHRIINGSL
ncbi:MAG: GxxExxY protein [Phycisphaeraceae bacterium]